MCRLINRNVNEPASGLAVSCTRSSSILQKPLIGLFFLVLICLGINPVALAKCGSSPRQLLWRNASNAELIKLDHSMFIPTVGAKTNFSAPEASSMSHEEDRPCSSCRCRNEKDPPVPVEPLVRNRTTSTICRFREAIEAIVVPSMDSHITNLTDSFLCPSLGQLEKPPKAMCS